MKKIRTLVNIDATKMVKVINDNPEKIFRVKASRVYAQIAKTGRDSKKKEARATLITAVNKANKQLAGTKSYKSPQYIPMKGNDIFKCFGKDGALYLGASLVKIDD